MNLQFQTATGHPVRVATLYVQDVGLCYNNVTCVRVCLSPIYEPNV